MYYLGIDLGGTNIAALAVKKKCAVSLPLLHFLLWKMQTLL